MAMNWLTRDEAICIIKPMTSDECHQRSMEARKLAAETDDLWQRQILFQIAEQWQLISVHRMEKQRTDGRPHLTIVKPSGDIGD
jgi:hypothetical protein